MSIPKARFDVLRSKDAMGFVFSSTMKNIDRVCEQAARYLCSIVFGIEKQLFPIVLVIREGLTNAVRHGNANDPGKIVRLELRIVNHDMVRVVIEDEGEGFDWREYQNQSPPENQDHGRGMIIMEIYCSRYFYNDKGNILFLERIIS